MQRLSASSKSKAPEISHLDQHDHIPIVQFQADLESEALLIKDHIRQMSLTPF